MIEDPRKQDQSTNTTVQTISFEVNTDKALFEERASQAIVESATTSTGTDKLIYLRDNSIQTETRDLVLQKYNMFHGII